MRKIISASEIFIQRLDRWCYCSAANPTEEANLKSQMEMTSMLKEDYSVTFAKNQAILGNLTTTLNNQIAKPQGYAPDELAAMRTQAMDTTTRQFAGAKAGAAIGAARYGGDVASGVTAQTVGGVAATEAATQASEQSAITQSNAALKRQNYWKGIQGLQDVASGYSPTGYAGAEIGSSNATTSAAKEVSAEKEQGFQNAMAMVKAGTSIATGAMGGMGIGNFG
jgi:hypothetical protein